MLELVLHLVLPSLFGSVYRGPRDREWPDIVRLMAVIAAHGWEISSDQEEYLAGPQPSFRKTMIRYRVKSRGAATWSSPETMALGPVREHSLAFAHY
jgi:hypothetical protein